MWKFTIFVVIFCPYEMVSGTVDVCIPRKAELDRTTTSGTKNPDHYTPHFPFDFVHPAIRAKGSLDNTYTSFGDYDFHIIDQHLQFFNFTLRNITNVGEYNITGNIGELFDIFGQGKYWLTLLDFSVASRIWIPRINSSHICVPLDLNIYLGESKGHFDKLMNDPELEDLFNRAITSLLPEFVVQIWADLKVWNHDIYQDRINKLINGYDKEFEDVRHQVREYFNKMP